MAQQFDPVLECMVSPHMKLVQPYTSQPVSRVGTAQRPQSRDLDPAGIEAVANELFDSADLDGDGLLDSDEFKAAYAKWEQNYKNAHGEEY